MPNTINPNNTYLKYETFFNNTSSLIAIYRPITQNGIAAIKELEAKQIDVIFVNIFHTLLSKRWAYDAFDTLKKAQKRQQCIKEYLSVLLISK